MPLGWIDFSKTERNKVLSVLDLLSEPGTLDELGFGPIRDGFADIFFPGTSTIQTRAKYFLIIPYALKDLELNKETNTANVLQALEQLERDCGQRFLDNNYNEIGVIGSNALKAGHWVKRNPTDIYWGGLRSYGIFRGGGMSLPQYVRAMCFLKQENEVHLKLGNKNDSSTKDSGGDDQNAGVVNGTHFWNIPTYSKDWFENLDIELTPEEGAFLKKQMCQIYPNSMLAYVLDKQLTEFFAASSFKELESIVHIFPEEMQADYYLAYDASKFLELINIQYNVVLSEGENQEANQRWAAAQGDLSDVASLDLKAIFARLQLHNNRLQHFLLESQNAMLDNDMEKLHKAIRRRERELKSSRAKTLNLKEEYKEKWQGVGALDYRFQVSQVIMRDILESEGVKC